MQGFIKVGDLSLTFIERNKTASDEQHKIIVCDVFTGQVETARVDEEVKAIEVLRDFLQIDGPTGLYTELFQQPEFNP